MITSISFEVFPPKRETALEDLEYTVKQLEAARPAFVSVTYGAGGSSRARSYEAIAAVGRGTRNVTGHLTCVGQSTDEIADVLDRYVELGVNGIVALRGDPPSGVNAPYTAHPNGYRRTADLVAAAADRFHVSVSAYPEKHPQSPDDRHDLDVLAEKVDAGATRAITQMFFDNDAFLRYRDRVEARGIDVAIVPGIFPVHSFPAVADFAARCAASIPPWFARRFVGLDQDAHSTLRVGAELAAQQIADLAHHGVEHAHVYTLNRAELALAVCQQLGLVHPIGAVA
jgi:methylenetetrahydrofolate reductase (NADPH)